MKREKSILAAFLLNLIFCMLELVGGFLTGSVAILSDSVHDLGDALSIGVSYALEKKSTREADEHYTYGYGRYSVIGGAFTTLVLLCGSVGVVCASVKRLLSPTALNYDGMILFAVAGVCVNLLAAYLTHGGGSVNRRAVSLHMLEDVLGWAAVLIGAVIMRFTDLSIIDPIMSLCTSAVILVGALRNMHEIVGIVTDKIPCGISVDKIREHVTALEGVEEIHHIHVRTIDGSVAAASMHVIACGDGADIKRCIRAELSKLGIEHATLELEYPGEVCADRECMLEEENRRAEDHGHHHHGRHHHH